MLALMTILLALPSANKVIWGKSSFVSSVSVWVVCTIWGVLLSGVIFRRCLLTTLTALTRPRCQTTNPPAGAVYAIGVGGLERRDQQEVAADCFFAKNGILADYLCPSLGGVCHD